jgi:hypothetical protein
MFSKKNNYFYLKIKWDKSGNPEYPFHTHFNEHKLQIKLNDFPEEQLYSLIVDGETKCNFDDWPANWEK